MRHVKQQRIQLENIPLLSTACGIEFRHEPRFFLPLPWYKELSKQKINTNTFRICYILNTVMRHKRHKTNTKSNPFESPECKNPAFCGQISPDTILSAQISSLTPFCMENQILSWTRNRDNATFIIEDEIYCPLMPVYDNSGVLCVATSGPTAPHTSQHKSTSNSVH
jgi:hypothetical protein